jgi:hypothetical protein
MWSKSIRPSMTQSQQLRRFFGFSWNCKRRTSLCKVKVRSLTSIPYLIGVNISAYAYIRGLQIPVDYILYCSAYNFSDLIVKLASCHPSGAWHFEMAPWYMGNLCTTAVRISGSIWVKFDTDVRILPLTRFVQVDADKDVLYFFWRKWNLPYFPGFHSIWGLKSAVEMFP